MLTCKVCTLTTNLYRHELYELMKAYGIEYAIKEFKSGEIAVYVSEQDATILKLKAADGNTDSFINSQLFSKKADSILVWNEVYGRFIFERTPAESKKLVTESLNSWEKIKDVLWKKS